MTTAEKKNFATIDDYIATFPSDVRDVLQKVRAAIRKAAPAAVEAISYQIPTFKLKGRNLIHFAGWKEHVSVYPIPAGDDAFRKEIAPYVAGKGTLKFMLDEPIPYDLIQKTVRFHLSESEQD